MNTAELQSTAPQPKPRWYRFTPSRFLVASLAVECFLWLSERFRWPPFGQHKGWSLLFAVAIVTAALLTLASWFAISRAFRLRFQFGLCSLLLLVVVVALPCTWLLTAKKNVRQQEEIVATLRRRGGEINFLDRPSLCGGGTRFRLLPPGLGWLGRLLDAKMGLFEDVHAVHLPANPDANEAIPLDRLLQRLRDLDQLDRLMMEDQLLSAKELEAIGELTQLRALHLEKTNVTDAGLKDIGKLRQLRELYVHNTNVTDIGLAQLSGLEQLQGLALGGTKVTDAGLKQLAGLFNLRWLSFFAQGPTIDIGDAGLEHLAQIRGLTGLNLTGTKVSDAGLAYLKGLTELKNLTLEQTAVSDAGLAHLKRLTKLQSLFLWHTRVTDDGIKELQQALPRCNIHREPTTIPPPTSDERQSRPPADQLR